MFERTNNPTMRYLQAHGAPGVRTLFMLALIVVIGFMCINGVAYAGTVKLPQTGQTTSYAIDDDGSIQAGVAWPNPRFTNNSDYTVTDNLTGLVWPITGGSLTVGSCTGGAMTWQGALDYVKCLNTAKYLGFSDWRLPNLNELDSLVNAGQNGLTTWLNTHGFASVHSDYYWSSTTYAYASSIPGAFAVHMNYGTMNIYAKSVNLYVWPVRTGASGAFGNAAIFATGQKISYATGDDGALQKGVAWPSPRFTSNSDYTITDNLTGLIWPGEATIMSGRACQSGTMTWQEALDAISCINKAGYLGHNDWRLPNRKEMLSLVDSSTYNPSLPSGNPFNAVQLDIYWLSTTLAYNTSLAWAFDMHDGAVGEYGKTNKAYVWPVRAGEVNDLAVSTSGTGSGSVMSSDGKINCGDTCTASYAPSASVTLTAKADFGSIFSGWGGSCTGTSSTCTLTMSEAKGVIAMFTLALVPTPTVIPTPTPTPSCNDSLTVIPTSKQFTQAAVSDSVSIAGPSICSWTAVSNDAWISITSGSTGAGNGTVKYSVSQNTDIGARIGTMTIAGKTVTITQTGQIVPIPTPTPTQVTLTVTKQGPGDGVVTSAPGSLNWSGKTATASFDLGTLVTLTPTPTVGSTVKTWTGCKFITGNMQCVVEMTADKGVTVLFVKIGAVAYDFDGDGKSDIVFENSASNDVALWLVNGLNHTPNYVAAGVNPAWKINAVADFNGDGKADILLQNSDNGALAIWFMDGAKITSGQYAALSMGSDWMVAGVGDFNGDGKADILFRYIPTGDIVVWLMDGSSHTSSDYVINNLPEQWKIIRVADFNGDGKADILLRNIDSGDIFIWFMDGSKIASGDFAFKGLPAEWEIDAVGDFNGDGKADIVFRDIYSGDVIVWLMDGAKISSNVTVVPGLSPKWLLKAVGDYDGDGKTDLLWQYEDTDDVIGWFMDGTSIGSFGYMSKTLSSDWVIK
ncbi:MAG: DUF1566 domain-containing protein [Nitrospirae bacterium]|nr:DUF1566 domain-containing protein [Nitrospirota bacterium]